MKTIVPFKKLTVLTVLFAAVSVFSSNLFAQNGTGTATGNPDVEIMPLELLSFDAALNKSKVDLRWTTLWERNLSHFVIERSVDSKEYKQVGLVFGVGNSDFKTNYSFSDDISELPNGIIYYRLKLMDADGKHGYSEIKVIRLGNNDVVNVLTYPNPVVNDLRVTVPSDWQGKQVNYELYDASGKIINMVARSRASQTEVISMNGVAPGLYIVKVDNGTVSSQQKIIKN